MPATALTGSRIRARRIALALKQGDVAAQAGISPSYLNLIEHNRRRIGGRLLNDIARALRCDATALAEGADATLLDALREAAATHPDAAEAGDMEALEDFAGRFPGWARRLAASHARAEGAARQVDALTDRLAHDPELSAALHEVLSTVTAIHSAASILVETKDIDPEWQARFQRNLAEDSARLTQSAETLVRYLDATEAEDQGALSPQEEMDAFLGAANYHFPPLERAVKPSPRSILASGPPLSEAAQSLLTAHLARYAREAAAMPLADFTAALKTHGPDPSALATAFTVPLAAVLRRFASLPPDLLSAGTGLVSCDGAGALTLRKEAEGFPLPRFGAACPLWPLYQALSRPMTPIRAALVTGRQTPRRFTAYAICEPLSAGFDGPQVLEATMLILPQTLAPLPNAQETRVGPACRICASPDCPARREPSVMA
ncbi:DUF2083 domain-containing protein [Alphaproteobacteria bacterium KMM 3653]|uniref:DUF2083 domain-containing protein n=1 Tax=Harenicola maris TaxID=2841044 RepID=A0AAP2CU89_9RHOB|nr:DUF2083 domain-containing protein [Harenicola maris]